MIGPYVVSVIRTLAGYLVAWLVSLPIAPSVEHAIGADSATAKVQLTGLFVFILGTVYYAAARAIEHRWPRAGILLGIPRAPDYSHQGALSRPTPGTDVEQLAEQIGAVVVGEYGAQHAQ